MSYSTHRIVAALTIKVYFKNVYLDRENSAAKPYTLPPCQWNINNVFQEFHYFKDAKKPSKALEPLGTVEEFEPTFLARER